METSNPKDIEEVGYLARTNAEHSGRIDCSFNDTVMALADVNVSLKDLMSFHSRTEEVPFARGGYNIPCSNSLLAIPRFPTGQRTKKRKLETKEETSVIPAHFPPFPEGYKLSNLSSQCCEEEFQLMTDEEFNKLAQDLNINITSNDTSL